MAAISLDIDGINDWGNPDRNMKDGDCISVTLQKYVTSKLADAGDGIVFSKMQVYLHSDTLEGFRAFAQGILDQLPPKSEPLSNA